MNNPVAVLLVLVGTVLIAAAILMILTGRSARQRGAAAWLTTPGLLTVGGAALLAGWLLPGVGGDGMDADVNRVLAEQAPAGGMRPPPRFGRIGVRVEGTPSDRGEASPSERHAYSVSLAAALADALVHAGVSEGADAQALSAATWSDTPPEADCRNHDLLVTIRLPAVRLPERDDYALWREPQFELKWCRTGAVTTHQFRVLERPGDRVPYEQAVRNRLMALLRDAPAPG